MAFQQTCFGPVDLPVPPKDVEKITKKQLRQWQNELGAEKALIGKGYDHIKEKIRSIRKAYNKAVSNGTKSGSGKVVQEFYEELSKIWKGCPASAEDYNSAGTSSFKEPECGQSDDGTIIEYIHTEENSDLSDERRSTPRGKVMLNLESGCRYDELNQGFVVFVTPSLIYSTIVE